MVTKRFSVAIVIWCLNLIAIWQHWLNSFAIGRWHCILAATNGSTSIFGCHLKTVKWQLNLEEIFWGYMSLKMQSMIHFLAPLFSFGFCVFGCPLTTIAWNLGWVEVIKSLVKGYVFRILQKHWTTLHLDFLKL